MLLRQHNARSLAVAAMRCSNADASNWAAQPSRGTMSVLQQQPPAQPPSPLHARTPASGARVGRECSAQELDGGGGGVVVGEQSAARLELRVQVVQRTGRGARESVTLAVTDGRPSQQEERQPIVN
jgi:hypothetical protein